jgi:hypothetical protein
MDIESSSDSASEANPHKGHGSRWQGQTPKSVEVWSDPSSEVGSGSGELALDSMEEVHSTASAGNLSVAQAGKAR